MNSLEQALVELLGAARLQRQAEDTKEKKVEDWSDIPKETKEKLDAQVDITALCVFKDMSEEEIRGMVEFNERYPEYDTLSHARKEKYFRDVVVQRALKFYEIYNNTPSLAECLKGR